MAKYIWLGGRRYYLYDTYPSWDKAYTVARHHNKKNKKNKYFILKTESYMTGGYKYKLYMTKFARLF
jgi:hypothetical protein